ncbi:MAG TPA: formate dehydrogenase accessory sulfurtransferase FdhD [Verrucomicrobiales bacterium]|jgi:FdhD protein|nr:formate dehydrogenase accessory sulfurtransferase FdhD [Verrucomicrobiales bacterium]
MPKSSLACEIIRWSERKESPIKDIIAVEEPLQVVVDGRPLAVLMRTPGDDEILVIGFLLTEGIIETISQVRSIDLEARDNHAMVFLSDDHECDWERLTRHLFSASSCGLCGKATVDAILQSHPPIGQKPEFDPVVIQSAPDTMRGAQSNFESTGGIHASGIFSQDGKLLILREDIGRHNALDKVIGEGLIKGIDFTHCFLLVSGRISFELMQKAIAARIPLVAGISAPSSLAVSFAKTSNQTLIGFLRPPHMNYYT